MILSKVAQVNGFASLWGLLVERGAAGRGSYISHDKRTGHDRCLTSAQLVVASTQASGGLQALRESPGRTGGSAHVLLVTSDPLSFIIGFFAAVRAGLVAVPAPSHSLVHPRHMRRLRALVASTNALAIVTDQKTAAPLARELPPRAPVIGLEDLQASAIPDPPSVPVCPVAYVQYTSGSQADPKPIALGHHNVLAHLGQAAEAFGEDGTSVAVSWTPLHHDMGLVTAVLRPLWSGYTSVLLDPFDFVHDPALWLRMISQWRATHTSAPDFGYSLCARKVTSTEGLDLRHLKVARSAGEPVRTRTLRAFSERFRPAGFDYAAFKPSYGLAEATLTVTTTALTKPPSYVRLSAEGLRQGLVRRCAESAAVEIASCGAPLRATRVAILDPNTGEAIGSERLGEVWIAGPQVVPFDDTTWTLDGCVGHRTGDIGFLYRGELYLLGRGSERFQVGGENFYSGELEAIASAVDRRLRPGRAAAFLGQPSHWPEPALVVVAECRGDVGNDSSTFPQLAKAIVAAIGHETGLSVNCVWLARQGSLAVTTSGKLQRERCRDAFEDGTIETLYRYQRAAR